ELRHPFSVRAVSPVIAADILAVATVRAEYFSMPEGDIRERCGADHPTLTVDNGAIVAHGEDTAGLRSVRHDTRIVLLCGGDLLRAGGCGRGGNFVRSSCPP